MRTQHWERPIIMCSASSLSSLPKVALEKISILVWLNRIVPEGMCWPLFLHSSFLQVINAVMLWSVRVQKFPRASKHLCLAKLQTSSDVCCACQSVCLLIPSASSMVLGSRSTVVFAAKDCMAICMSVSTVCSRCLESVRMTEWVICASLWETSHSSACVCLYLHVTASTSIERSVIASQTNKDQYKEPIKRHPSLKKQQQPHKQTKAVKKPSRDSNCHPLQWDCDTLTTKQ